MSAPERSPTEAPPPAPDHVSIARVALMAALGPTAWMVDLSARFFLVEFGFARAHEGVVIGIGALSCAVAMAAAIECQRLRRRALDRGGAGQGSASHGSASEGDEVGFAATLGVALGAFSALVIAAALVPHLYFDGAGVP